MFVLHAVWRPDGRLALWAEHAVRGDALLTAPGVHPLAAPPETLRALLGWIGPGLGWLAGQTDEDDTELRLPTVGSRPLPSPELAPPMGFSDAAVLAAWAIPSLVLTPTQAAQLLGEFYDPRHAAVSAEIPGEGLQDVPLGASLRWLTRVHDLAWRLVGRGRVLPSLRSGPAGPEARWSPAPTAADRRESAALAAACPPVSLAAHGDTTATGLLQTVLPALTDAEARAALEAAPPLLAGRRPPATFPERWLTALQSPEGRLDQPPSDDGSDAAARLGARLRAWLRAGAAGADGPLRVGFRVVEPPVRGGDEEDDAWWVELVLHPAGEPSLLLTAGELWAEGPAAQALRAQVPDPEGELGRELERAARLRPELSPALLSRRPEGLPLDRSGALEFLRGAAPELDAAGFFTLLPAWWREPPSVGLLLTARPLQAGVVERPSPLGRDELLEFRWQLALGGAELSSAEMAELAAARGTLVRIRGGWVAADAARLAAAAAFLAGPDAEGEATAAEILRMVMDGQESAGLPVSVRDVTGPLRALIDELHGHAHDLPTDPPLKAPPGFGGSLRPYQRAGLAWLVRLTRLGLGGVLADDMGLGKTVQTLALLALEQAAPEPPAAPTLLVCPMSLVGNWEREAARFAPKLRVHVHHGADRVAGRALREVAAEADLVITTYGLAQRDFTTLRQIAWHRVVADEAHHIKNSATLQSRAVRSLPARHRLALTGTPVENRLAELHAVLDFANPGLFGDAERFKERWSVPIERNASVRATAELRARTRPFLLRRLKSDPAVAAELPGKQEMTLLCNLTPEQAGLYRAVVNDLMLRVEQTRGRERHGLVLAALTRLKQVCDHPALYAGESGPGVRLEGRSGKLAALEDVLEQALAEGDSALCFTQYAAFGSLLQPYLERQLRAPVLFLHGGVPERRRRELVDRFQQSGRPAVFLLSLKAGGAGLNLTAANQVVHLDRWWNPAVEEQATDRAHRIGQSREVQVRRLVCVGTVEERVSDMLEAKRALADAVIGSVGASGEDWLAELSAEALREALALAEEAVSEA